MVGVAQLVEHLVVVQVAAGSSPVTHPTALVATIEPSSGTAGGGSIASGGLDRVPACGDNIAEWRC